jgi:hypothetical protein
MVRRLDTITLPDTLTVIDISTSSSVVLIYTRVYIVGHCIVVVAVVVTPRSHSNCSGDVTFFYDDCHCCYRRCVFVSSVWMVECHDYYYSMASSNSIWR